jgi:hypothetical protein
VCINKPNIVGQEPTAVSKLTKLNKLLNIEYKKGDDNNMNNKPAKIATVQRSFEVYNFSQSLIVQFVSIIFYKEFILLFEKVI